MILDGSLKMAPFFISKDLMNHHPIDSQAFVNGCFNFEYGKQFGTNAASFSMRYIIIHGPFSSQL